MWDLFSFLWLVLFFSTTQWAACSVIPDSEATAAAPEVRDAGPISLSDKHTANFEINVPCQEDDESINLAFEVSTPVDAHSPCGHPQVRVNGLHVYRTWDDTGTGRASLRVETEGPTKGTIQVLRLTSESSCISGSEDGKLDTPLNVFSVNSTDPSQPNCSANFALNLPEIIKSLPQIPLSESSDLAHNDVDFESTPSSDASLEDEVQKLESLQKQLKKLRSAIEYQELRVQYLAQEDLRHGIEDLGQCETVTCVLKTAFQKAKTTFKVFCLKFGSHRYPAMAKSGNKSNDIAPQSSLLGTEKSRDSKCSCPAEESDHGSHDSKENPFSHSQQESHPIYLTALDIVAGLICMGCLYSSVYSRCCSPRAKAERAARREERENLRQYRSLARRHAWSNWWNHTVLRRGNTQRSGDYEEKRSLINAQEAVLETAMQEEIRRLRRAHGYVDEYDAAESGRVSPSGHSGAETLPPYRSRTSSGRPPSYHEYEDGVRVVNNFRSYTPSGTEDTPNDTESLANSSVPALSPRHSFDTLRTERSVV